MTEFVTITWKVHLNSSPEIIYNFLNSNEGREKFWATKAIEEDGYIHFVFPNGFNWKGKILERKSPKVFKINYIDNSVTSFKLVSDLKGGTDLTLTDENVEKQWEIEVNAGWVSVLMSLKGAIDFGIDLRNNDPHRTWDKNYCDN